VPHGLEHVAYLSLPWAWCYAQSAPWGTLLCDGLSTSVDTSRWLHCPNGSGTAWLPLYGRSKCKDLSGVTGRTMGNCPLHAIIATSKKVARPMWRYGKCATANSA